MKHPGAEICDLMGQEVWLLPEKALFWPEKSVLMLADLHLGKALHFRKAGISVPRQSQEKDLMVLQRLLDDFAPSGVIFLGDLFHSDRNEDWDVFGAFLQENAAAKFTLVRGNHDILETRDYRRYGLSVQLGSQLVRPFHLTHHPQEEVPEGWYNLAGHVHPGVRLAGRGKQGMRLPCFWFGPQSGLLPAFGHMTGLGLIKPKTGDQVFVIAGEEVIRV